MRNPTVRARAQSARCNRSRNPRLVEMSRCMPTWFCNASLPSTLLVLAIRKSRVLERLWNASSSGVYSFLRSAARASEVKLATARSVATILTARPRRIRMLRPGSLGEQELQLQAQLPVRCVVRLLDVVVRRCLQVHRLLAEAHDLPDAQPERHGPALPAVGFPVRGDDRSEGEIAPRRVGKVV